MSIGVLQWSGIAGEECPRLAQIREERGYSYTDIVNVTPDKLPNYEDKIKAFYREHIHYDEEIRLILEGTGYFDVRDHNDKWIRVALEAGEFSRMAYVVAVVAGSYHRRVSL
jgi:1,2-dihydroxy-3-keto-5-methylthiopentene dioxygenase